MGTHVNDAALLAAAAADRGLTAAGFESLDWIDRNDLAGLAGIGMPSELTFQIAVGILEQRARLDRRIKR